MAESARTSRRLSGLMAGIVTGCGIVFAWHSMTETSRLRATDTGATWHQAGLRLREVGPRRARAA